MENQEVAESKSDGRTRCVPSDPEAVTASNHQGPSDKVTKPTKPTHEIRLAILTDLLANLPETDRRELIADLPTSDRVAIARRLIGTGEQTANPREYQ